MNLVILGGSGVLTPAFFAALPGSRLHLRRVCLVGRSAAALERVGRYCLAVARERQLPVADVAWETDLARAADGADVVLNLLRDGGFRAQEQEARWLAGSGVVGHAATFPQAIRNLPPTVEAARVVERVAPRAHWINFSNPVTVLCEAVALATGLCPVGLCSQAFAFRGDFAALFRADPAAVRVQFLGLNHLGWITDVLVDGVSRMDEAVALLRQRRSHRYNYWYARPDGIPVDQAFSLYHKGDTWYDRQKGARGSLAALALRFGRLPADLRREGRERAALERAIATGDTVALARFGSAAPWYASCIVPFLAALQAGSAEEFVVTWRHRGQCPALPGTTAESAAILREGRLEPTQVPGTLPPFAAEWLRQARASERLLIAAVAERSPELVAQALVMHPSVASYAAAERLAALACAEWLPAPASRAG